MDAQKMEEIEGKVLHAWEEVVKMEERLRVLTEMAERFEERQVEGRKQLTDIDELHITLFEKPEGAVKSKAELILENSALGEQFQKAVNDGKQQLDFLKELIEGNKVKGFNGFKEDMTAMIKDWGEGYNTMLNKIEGLLPGATATGLSKSYQDQKKNFILPLLLWSIVFVTTVGGMMWFGYTFYKDTETIEESLMHILARLPFFIPAVWLAVFAGKQQSRYFRLQQEYIYKETLSKSYEAYKREIDKLPDGDTKVELNEKLIKAMVEMCGYNPSQTLENKGHSERPPFSLKNFIPGSTPPPAV